MSFYEFNSTDQKSTDKVEARPELFRGISDLDLKFDAESFKESQTKATVDLVKNGVLPDTNLFDFGVHKPEGPLKQPETFKSGDKDHTAKLEFDKDGKPVKFTDYNKDVYEKGSDGQWYRGKPMFNPPQKVDLSVSPEGTVTIKYPVEGDKTGEKRIARSIQKDGTEVTKYPEGPVTTRTRHKDGETLTVTNSGQTHTLQYDKNQKLVSFTAADGTKFERNAAGSWDVIDLEYGTRRSLDKVGPDGKLQKGHVRADSNGSVTVRDENTTNFDRVTTRHLNTGVIIHSDNSGQFRTTITPDGLTIKDKAYADKSDPTQRTLTRSFEYRDKDGNLTGHVTITRDGTRQTIKGKIDGKEIDLERDGMRMHGKIDGRPVNYVITEKDNDSITIRTRDGKTYFINGEGKLVDGDSHQPRKFDQRSSIDEMPKDYQEQLDQRVKEIEAFKDKFAKNLKMTRKELDEQIALPVHLRRKDVTAGLYIYLYNQTRDGGPFDNKQQGGQYQKWGNFAFGVYASALGLSGFEVRNATWAYKLKEGKKEDMKDYEDIDKGYAYYEQKYKRQAA